MLNRISYTHPFGVKRGGAPEFIPSLHSPHAPATGDDGVGDVGVPWLCQDQQKASFEKTLATAMTNSTVQMDPQQVVVEEIMEEGAC